MDKYKVVIIGGGPAGSTLGCLLVKAGIDTLIIDKCNFPRKKLCAGGLTYNAFNLYDKLIGKENFSFVDQTKKTKLFYQEEYIMDVEHGEFLRFVDRDVFDNELFSCFNSLGGKSITGNRAVSFDEQNKIVKLSDGSEVGYDILVGADGACSVVRKLLDKDFYPDTFCLETSVLNTTDNHTVSMYLGLGGGYGWIFPHGERLSIGYGGHVKRAKENTDEFKDFLKFTGVDVENEQFEVRGAFIPMRPVKTPASKRVFLVGDAGGFVFPATGEGLYYAAYTAENAFLTIVDLLDGKISEEQVEMAYKGRLSEIYRVSDEAYTAIGNGKKGEKKRKFMVFCQNSKLIRKIIFNYCRKRPELVSYAYEQVATGVCFDPFKIRKEYIKNKKLKKKSCK